MCPRSEDGVILPYGVATDTWPTGG